MKFTANKSDLMAGVGIAIRAVPSHTTMKILECILIEAKGSEIILTANDMEMGIETRVKAGVEVPGTVAVDARMFSESFISILSPSLAPVDAIIHGLRQEWNLRMILVADYFFYCQYEPGFPERQFLHVPT